MALSKILSTSIASGAVSVTELAERPASDFGAGTGGTTNTYTENGISYQSHTFTSSGTFTVTTAGYFDILVVAGGGGGGGYHSGGGGAGNALIINDTISTGSYSIVIGAGGTSVTGGYGYPGTNTTAFGETAFGGGGGAKYAATQGDNGGCGGSGAAQADTTNGQGGAGSSGKLLTKEGFRYGNPAGTSHFWNHDGAGGGGAGGMGEHGGWPINNVAGDGGAGIGNTYRTGSTVNYAGGGGGGSWGGTVGSGSAGGGNGSASNNYNATAGGANTGSGGGGNGGQTGGAGGSGGSGIVVIRYKV